MRIIFSYHKWKSIQVLIFCSFLFQLFFTVLATGKNDKYDFFLYYVINVSCCFKLDWPWEALALILHMSTTIFKKESSPYLM